MTDTRSRSNRFFHRASTPVPGNNVVGPGTGVAGDSTDRAIATWNGNTGTALYDNPDAVITANAGLELSNAASYAAFGVIPADAGVIRLPSVLGLIGVRNAGDTADIPVLLQIGDNLIFGNPAAGAPDRITIGADTDQIFAISGSSKLTIDTNLVTLTGNADLAIGGTVALAGAIRLDNNTGILARDAGDAGDIPIVGTNAGDDIQIGGNDTDLDDILIDVPTSQSILCRVAGATELTIAGDLVTIADALAFGAAPAQSGVARYEVASVVNARNSAGTNDRRIWETTADDRRIFGTIYHETRLEGNNTNGIRFYLGAGESFSVNQTLVSTSLPLAIGGIGGTPATTGALRLENATTQQFRNAANTQDIQALTVDGSNNLQLGVNSSNMNHLYHDVAASKWFYFRIGGVFKFSLGTSASFSVPVVLPSYTVVGAPVTIAGAMVYITNEVGGAVPAFYDGSDWRRVTDRAVIST